MTGTVKITPSLFDFKELLWRHGGQVSLTNIDDIFTDLALAGVREVVVDQATMLMIVKFMVANVQYEKFDEGKNELDAWKALSEGVTDKFLGVKLNYDATRKNPRTE